ncbi:MAG: hypothetical protein JXN64_08040 [Spirochaetes bacterium]|nr:hypothetical protein [Spirochaetota bacterium]
MKTSICTNGFSIFLSIVILVVLYCVVPFEGTQSEGKNIGINSRIVHNLYPVKTFIMNSVIKQEKAHLYNTNAHTTHGNPTAINITGLFSFNSGNNIPFYFNNGRVVGIPDLSDNISYGLSDSTDKYTTDVCIYGFTDRDSIAGTGNPAEPVNRDHSRTIDPPDNNPDVYTASTAFLPSL